MRNDRPQPTAARSVLATLAVACALVACWLLFRPPPGPPAPGGLVPIADRREQPPALPAAVDATDEEGDAGRDDRHVVAPSQAPSSENSTPAPPDVPVTYQKRNEAISAWKRVARKRGYETELIQGPTGAVIAELARSHSKLLEVTRSVDQERTAIIGPIVDRKLATEDYLEFRIPDPELDQEAYDRVRAEISTAKQSVDPAMNVVTWGAGRITRLVMVGPADDARLANTHSTYENAAQDFAERGYQLLLPYLRR